MGLAGLALAAFLNFPQPAFAYQVTAGRLSLYSDRAFDADKARGVLMDAQARLASSPLDDAQAYSVFIANGDGLRRVVFTVGGGAAGINYYPLTANVFLRRADVAGDRLYGQSGRPAAPPRTLAYYIAHEVAHTLTAKRLGPGRLWNWGLPQWVREGYADYVGLGGRVDIADLHRRYLVGDPELDFTRSHTYSRFRMLTAYLLQRRGWTVDQLLATRLTEAEALAMMDADLGRRRS